MVSARKRPYGDREIEGLLKRVDDVYIGRGGKYEHVSLSSGASDKKEIIGKLKGPTGNLRAPALLKGKTLIVGFNEEMYRKALL